jgi:hypothetical protein
MTSRCLGVVVGLLLSLTIGAVSADQRPTLPEMARHDSPAPVIRDRWTEYVMPSFEEIVSRSNLIVHGRVESKESYLSDDQYEIYTDYVLTPIRILWRQAAQVPSPIIVKRWGGEMTIEGAQVIARDHGALPIEASPEVVLVLIPGKTSGKFQLVSEFAGVFSIEAGYINPLTPDPKFKRFHSMPIAQFESEIQRLKR